MRRTSIRVLTICLILCMSFSAAGASLPVKAVALEDGAAGFSAEILTNIIDTEQHTMANDIRLTNTTTRTVNAIVYNALYNASGILIGTGRQSVKLEAGSQTVVSVGLRYTDRTEGCVQRIYLWDTLQRPLMEPLVNDTILFETTPAKLNLSQTQATLWMKETGEQLTRLELTTAIEPTNAVIQRVTWQSSAPEIATVDAYGNVTAKSRGEAVITATAISSGVSESCAVSVKLEPDSLYFEHTELELVHYEEDALADPGLRITPDYADLPELVWESSNPDVAVVIDGKIHARREGTAVISAAAAHNPALRAECIVRVTQAAVHLSLNQTQVNLWDDGVYQLVATIQPTDFVPSIEFTSSDPSVAEVDGTGLITARKKGTTVITVSTGSLQAQCQVTVYRETDYIGQASARYESNGNPATISSGAGDSGGKSYGAYQFSSAYRIPYDFALWLVSSGENAGWGERLKNAYAADGNAFSSNFDSTWKAIASEDSANFLLAQHAYIKVQYYDVAVQKLWNNYGFSADNYGTALKSAIWSRAVQHGSGGAVTVIGRAFDALGGFEGQSEEALIRAIYAESGMALSPSDSSQTVVTSENAKQYVDSNGNYLIYGKYLKYYPSSSASVQYGVWKRLNIDELNDLIDLIHNPPVDITK